MSQNWDVEWKGNVVNVHKIGSDKRWVYELIEEPYCDKCGNSLIRGSKCFDYHRHDCLTLADGSFQLGKYYKGTKLDRQDELDILTQHIHMLKDNDDFAEPIGVAMYLAIMNKYKVLQNANLLVPVPSYGKLKNHSYAICEVIVSHLQSKGIDISINSALRKISDIQLHKLPTLEDRVAAVQGMFESTTEISVRGKDVILVDDILTSGDTKCECIRILKMNGARKVWVFVAGGNVN